MSWEDVTEVASGLLSDTDIADLSAVADTTVYTVPTGKVLVLNFAYLRVAGDVGADLVCSIGQNTAETDFVGNTNGDNLDAAGDMILMMPVPSATPATLKTYAAATVIEFSVSVDGSTETCHYRFNNADEWNGYPYIRPIEEVLYA